MDHFKKLPTELVSAIFEALINNGGAPDAKQFRAVCVRFSDIATPFLHACTILPLKDPSSFYYCRKALSRLERSDDSKALVKTLWIPPTQWKDRLFNRRDFHNLQIRLQKILSKLENIQCLRSCFGSTRVSGTLLHTLNLAGKPMYLKYSISEEDWTHITNLKASYIFTYEPYLAWDRKGEICAAILDDSNFTSDRGFFSLTSPVFLDITNLRIWPHPWRGGYRGPLRPREHNTVLSNLLNKLEDVRSLDMDANSLCTLWEHCDTRGHPFPLSNFRTFPKSLGLFEQKWPGRTLSQLNAEQRGRFRDTLHLQEVEKLALNYSFLSKLILLPEAQLDALASLQIDVTLLVEGSDSALVKVAFFEQVNMFLKSVTVKELQLFGFDNGPDLDAIMHSGSELRVLQYRFVNLYWESTSHYSRPRHSYYMNCPPFLQPQSFMAISKSCPAIEMLSFDFRYVPDNTSPIALWSPRGVIETTVLGDEMISALSSFPNLHHLDIYIWADDWRTPALDTWIPSMFEDFRAKKIGCPLKRVTITQAFVRGSVCVWPGSQIHDAFDTGSYVDIKHYTCKERSSQRIHHERDGFGTERLSMEDRWYLPH